MIIRLKAGDIWEFRYIQQSLSKSVWRLLQPTATHGLWAAELLEDDDNTMTTAIGSVSTVDMGMDYWCLAHTIIKCSCGDEAIPDDYLCPACAK